MSRLLKKALLSGGIVFVFLLADQAIKFWVKTHMFLHDSIRITDWFYILFTENNGMAFGMELMAKPVLTVFRMLAVCILVFYLVRFILRDLPWGFIICISLVVVGALGNIIDCLFYGVYFTESSYAQIAEFLPQGGGYAAPLEGLVVDMFYFPLVEFDFPESLPLVGGDHFVFFSPVFNFADSCICCGVIAILLFYSRFMTRKYLSFKQEP